MRALAILALVACHHAAPACPTPPPVTIVAPRAPCALPQLPGPLDLQGKPAAGGIVVTQDRWAELAGWLSAVDSWITAAQGCISP